MKHLAIAGGTPSRTAPFTRWPIHSEAERKALLRVLDSGSWGGFPSPNTEASAFAAAFASYHGAKYGVCAANGTVTLLLALRAAGVTRGDEVIVPPYTFAATAAAAIYMGAVPVFADVRRSDYLIDPAAVEAAITSRTKAVICVHIGANVCDLDRLTEICKKKGLVLIEDCAHMHGAKWRDRGVGSWGDYGSFSFQSSKLMTSGEGGIVVTSDPRGERQLLSLVNCGRREGSYAEAENWLGYNFRLSEFQCAVLRAQLDRLDEQTKKRAENFALLSKKLATIPGVSNLEVDTRITQRAGYQFIFRYEKAAFAGRDKLKVIEALEAEGIPADEGYRPLNRQHELMPAGAMHQWYDKGAATPKLDPGACPVAQSAWDETIWLPHQLFLGPPEDVNAVAEAVAKVQAHADEI